MAQENSQKKLQVVELPDLSKATDEEIDKFAQQIWEKFVQTQ